MTETKWVVLAHLVRPQGRNGELLAEILTDFPERFSARKRLFLVKPDAGNVGPGTPREVVLERHWLHKGRIVLKFSAVDSISDAEGLRGLDVVIPWEERAPLDEDAVYVDDLVGCRVFDLHGNPGSSSREVGEIVDVDRESSAGDLLVVRSKSGPEVLIPFVKAFLKRIDVAGRRIEMDLPEGLLELNAPLSSEEKQAKIAQEKADAEP